MILILGWKTYTYHECAITCNSPISWKMVAKCRSFTLHEKQAAVYVAEVYVPTVPILSGQSRYYYLNPTSRPLVLESLVCPAISEHSNCHSNFVYDACTHTTQALQSEAGLSGPRVCENLDIDSKVRRLARVCGMAEGGRRRKTVAHGDDPSPETKRRKNVSSSVVGHQPTMALKRATEVQLMRDAHTVASTSIFLTVEKIMSRNTSAHLVTERQCALVKALQISAVSLHLNLLNKALKLKLDGLCSSQSTMSHFWQVIMLLSSLRKCSPT